MKFIEIEWKIFPKNWFSYHNMWYDWIMRSRDIRIWLFDWNFALWWRNKITITLAMRIRLLSLNQPRKNNLTQFCALWKLKIGIMTIKGNIGINLDFSSPWNVFLTLKSPYFIQDLMKMLQIIKICNLELHNEIFIFWHSPVIGVIPLIRLPIGFYVKLHIFKNSCKFYHSI